MPSTEPPREAEFEFVGREKSRDARRPGDDPFIAFVARLMDDLFVIPGTKIRFGLDPIISLLPALGSGASAMVSIILIGLSARRGVPKIVLVHMATNVLINTALDSLPVVGDVISIFYRSNARNYELLQKHAGQTRASTRGDWFFLIALLTGVVLVIGLMILGTVTMFRMILAPFSH